jgi:hypothetical protein
MADRRSSCARIFNTVHASSTVGIHSARSAPEMLHSYLSWRDNDLGITQCFDIDPVDTQAEWSRVARVRCVKLSQPQRRAGVRLLLRVPACSATQPLGLSVRKARGKPVERLPAPSLESQLRRIPSPLSNRLLERKHSYEAKGSNSVQVQSTERCLQPRQRRRACKARDDLPSASRQVAVAGERNYVAPI